MNNLKYIIGFFIFFTFFIVLSQGFYTSLGMALFVFSITKFIIDLGSKIEIKDVIVLLALLEWVVGPFLAYYFYPDDPFYYMAVDQETYMRLVVPASFALMLGLYISIGGKKRNEDVYLYKVSNLIKKYKSLDIWFVFVGVVLNIFVREFPVSIRFAVSLFSDIRFVGLFLLLISNRKNKWLIIGGVLFLLLLAALKHAMFHDLLLWLSFFIMIASFVYKPTLKKKISYLFLFVVFIVIIQTVKHGFRESLKEGSGEGIELFANLVQEKVVGSDYVTSESNLSAMVTRINQGWIIARIMSWTPSREPFAEGETIIEAFKSALMPRIFFPNKLKAGGRTYFTRFTGKTISEGTSMGLGLVGEAYANYGVFGGVVFLFLIGLSYNWLINRIYKIANKHPAIIFFIPLIFLQVVKAEIDFSVILNYLVKSIIAVWFMFWSMNKVFKIKI